MPDAPRKNISPVLSDVKPTRNSASAPSELPPQPPKKLSVFNFPIGIPIRWFHKVGIIGVIVFIGFGVYGTRLLRLQQFAQDALRNLGQDFERLQKQNTELDPAEATATLNKTLETVTYLNSQAEQLGIGPLAHFLNAFIPGIQTIPHLLQEVNYVTVLSLQIAEAIKLLQSRGVEFLLTKNPELPRTLETLRDLIRRADELNTSIVQDTRTLQTSSSEFASLNALIDENYLPLSSITYTSANFIQGVLSLLKSSEPQHLLLLFQNPSEIRPSGGFTGSYGYLTFREGAFDSLTVDDIYNADRQLDIKLIPPRELQTITRDWETRDANWFADFPTSAQKVITLIEQVTMFKDAHTTFQGAIGLNTNILETLLEIIGPVRLDTYDLTITKENFLQEIQYEVEAGRDKKPGQNPKRILSTLAPILLERLQHLSDEQKTLLVTSFETHLQKKDIMLYFQNWDIQQFLTTLGFTGDITPLPEQFSGDYLHVVNANLASGKTDAFIDQTTELASRISADGTVTNELSITRTHSGQNEKDWWYTVPNKNFLKVLVPPGAQLFSVEPGSEPTPQSSYAYIKNGYHADPNLDQIEAQEKFSDGLLAWIGNEFGKASFGGRFVIPAGETKTVTLKYERQLPAPLSASTPYQFIFEKQSGVQDHLRYTVIAPPSYIWKESGTETFSYTALNPNSRESLTLTLQTR